ncbi:murein DD-endopeptidase MepM [Thorsellia kenyensis]|uniref:Murein DD-endopeptidase MepM n=1 Tax=Thorsellia kenyensis TaxID=1549888 RepID=A0ABV6CBJ8_9GAMM
MRILQTSANTYTSMPIVHRALLVSLTIITVGLAFFDPNEKGRYDFMDGLEVFLSSSDNPSFVLSPDSEFYDVLPYPAESEGGSPPITDFGKYEHIIQSGDTLSSVLNQYGVDLSDISKLTKNNKILSNMGIGQTLSWELDDNGGLKLLKWSVSKRETRTYELVGNQFEEVKDIIQGEWVEKTLQGEIQGSLSEAAKSIGLTKKEIAQMNRALSWQFNLKSLKKGDKLVAVVSRELIDGDLEQSQLLGVRINTDGKDYYALQAENGNFYDIKGYAPSQGFLRTPMSKSFKVSSHFNPRRLNPVTKRIAPHNGVDYAMPIGTPILAVGDGVVTHAKREGAAGNYIAIKHNGQYTTRYMHLKSLHVKPGQKVKRGQKIGLSGNTGRSTGPHLHYEIWINGKAVNPLKANLPRTESMSSSDKKAFENYVAPVKDKLIF